MVSFARYAWYTMIGYEDSCILLRAICPELRAMDMRDASSTTSAEQGMTLVEIMTAAGLIGVAFLFILGAVLSVNETRATVQQQARAISELSSVTESLRSVAFTEILELTDADIALLAPDQDLTVECFTTDGEAVPLPLPADVSPGALPNPLEVRVTVTWNGPRGRMMSRSASVLLVR